MGAYVSNVVTEPESDYEVEEEPAPRPAHGVDLESNPEFPPPKLSFASYISQTAYAYSKREINAIVNTLRKFSIPEVFPLPRIAVIGKQSSGKSSFIEGLSDITLPRGPHICTRCPIEVRMRDAPGTKWSCKVSLNVDNAAGGGSESNSCRLFRSTDEPKDVELILRQAQVAVVKGITDFTAVSHLTREECDEKFKIPEGNTVKADQHFSARPITVEIEGADSELTFIDLPGLIHNVCIPFRPSV
jgi:Dynamin family